VVKLLKWIAVTINSLLLIVGLIVTIFGIILWKTDFNTFSDEFKDFVPKALSEETGEPPQVPAIFVWLGKFVMAFGLFIMCLSIIGLFALTCCSDKCKCFLILYLIILVIVTCVQIAIVVLSYNTSTLQNEVNKNLKPVFIGSARKTSDEFVIATQIFLQCCGINGFKDYYCADKYDPFCNFKCNLPTGEKLKMGGKNGKELPLCPEEMREAKGTKKTTGICGKNPDEFSNDFLKDVAPSYKGIIGIKEKKALKEGKKPTDLPGCSKKVFDEIEGNLKYVQITCIVVLCIELFCMLVTVILICKQKNGGENKRRSSDSRSSSR